MMEKFADGSRKFRAEIRARQDKHFENARKMDRARARGSRVFLQRVGPRPRGYLIQSKLLTPRLIVKYSASAMALFLFFFLFFVLARRSIILFFVYILHGSPFRLCLIALSIARRTIL